MKSKFSRKVAYAPSQRDGSGTRVLTEKPELAFPCVNVAHKKPNGGGFASPVWPKIAKDFTPGN
jgi:hypothetical protein